MSTAPLRVCFVAPNALPVIAPEIAGPLGGIETRSWLFARALARRQDVAVSVVVRDAVQSPRAVIDNVHVLTLVEPLTAIRRSIAANIVRQPNFPWVQIRRWSWSLCWKLPLLAGAKLSRQPHGLSGGVDPFLMSIETDLFCTFGVNPASASAVQTAHARGLRSVLVLGSDGDLDPRFIEGGSYANQYGDRGDMMLRLLNMVDRIVAQTPLQQELLNQRFGRDADLVVNPIDVAEWEQQLQLPCPVAVPASRYVLWIGRADITPKQPLKVLEIARELPQVPFLMVLNPFDPVVEEAVHRDKPANVFVVPRVAPGQIATLFARAAALLNTSTFEGFPNTFLQAAVSQVPIVSLLVTPRSSVAQAFGVCAEGQLHATVTALNRIVAGEHDRDKLNRLRAAVIAQHDVEATTAQLLNVFRDTISR